MLLFIFWASAAIIVYTYIGYPVTLMILAKIRAQPVKKAPFSPSVSFIIAGYNEASRIGDKINNLFQLDYDPEKIELVIASDGSSDDMVEKIREFGRPNIKVLPFDERRGKAACLNDAVAAASHEYLVFADVRQTFAPRALSALMENFADENVGAVSGELVFVEENESSTAASVDAYWRYEKFIRASEAKIDSVPGVTGAIYALKKSLFDPIPPGTILDDVLIPMQMLIKHRKRVVFESEAQAYDKPSTDVKKEEARKKRTLAGNYQLIALLPSVLNPFVNPIFFQFFSHKVLRLLAPAFLVLLFVASFLLAPKNPFYFMIFMAQVAFYGLFLIGLKVEALANSFPGKIARSFCIMNWFAVLGFWQYVKERDTHLWK